MTDLVTQLRERATKTTKRIVYPEEPDGRVLPSARSLVVTRMAKPVLVGAPQAVEAKAKELGIALSHIEVIDPKIPKLLDRYVRLLLPEWKSRGITEVEALKRLENPA